MTIDLSKMSQSEKDNMLKQLLDWTMSLVDANKCLQNTMLWVQKQQSNNIADTITEWCTENQEWLTSSPYDEYRDAMVIYAEFFDIHYFKDVNNRREITNDLRKVWEIRDLPEWWTHMIWLNFKTIGKEAHNAFVQKTFKDNEVIPQSYTTHTFWLETYLEVKKHAVDAWLEKENLLEYNIIIANKIHLDQMLDWIEEKYKVKKLNEKLYILCMINPDLLGCAWINDLKWNFRFFTKLMNRVKDSGIKQGVRDSHKARLFLVEYV
jgi:hypothetical protein